MSPHGAFLGGLDEIAGFDAEFFGIAGHEAVAMDPQHRMLLEVACEALDHAALPAPALAGTRTGVFVGISGNEYAHLTTADPGAVDAWTATGASLSIAAGRLSYALDLRGPSMAVDTACSSSLVAVHLAVRSLRQRRERHGARRRREPAAEPRRDPRPPARGRPRPGRPVQGVRRRGRRRSCAARAAAWSY